VLFKTTRELSRVVIVRKPAEKGKGEGEAGLANQSMFVPANVMGRKLVCVIEAVVLHPLFSRFLFDYLLYLHFFLVFKKFDSRNKGF
jgi:hypothetical protein